jgi:predicted nucleic-acid-binding Zn-ribbon protein
MKNEIDYSDYSIEELLQAYDFVNKDKYPEQLEKIKLEIAKRQGAAYQCPKCGGNAYETSSFLTHTNVMASAMNAGSAQFRAITCLSCGFTEIYKVHQSIPEQMVKFLFSS